MFQFSGFAHLSVYYVFNIVGCPIQVFTDQFVCADPRNFSQLITPFIASESQGIPHTPLFCLLYFVHDAMNRVCTRIVMNHNTCSFYFLYFLSQYVNELLFLAKLVENIGVEPMTSCVQGRRSSQLS